MKEILKKLRKYEIRVRKAINSQMQGDFKSIFKGSGLEFDDIRTYQYGDDIRSIDWNVTAKGQGTFLKTFKEEKEQTVFFLLDVSASQEIGKEGRKKIDIGKELTALLSISAIKENSQVGLMCYSDKVESYLKPAKGIKHSNEIINSLFKLIPKSKKTDLNSAIKYLLNILKRKSVIFVISDFIDQGYSRSLKGMSHKHDLIAIQLFHPREFQFPKVGIIPLHENESKQNMWVNSSSSKFRKMMEQNHLINTLDLERFCARNGANYTRISTEEDYVPELLKLFIERNKKKSSQNAQ